MFRTAIMIGLLVGLQGISIAELITFDNGMTNLVETDLSTDYIEVRDNATLGATTVIIRNGATIGTSEDGGDNSVKVFGTSFVEMQGGVLLDDALATETSRIQLRGGTVGDDLQAIDSALIEVFGGTVADETQSNNTSTIHIFDGDFDDDIEAYDNSLIRIHGGTAGEDIEAFDSSHIHIFGGSIGQGALVTRGVGALDTGMVTLYGSSFFVNDVAVTSSGAITDLSGTITGFLSDGTALDTDFVRDSTAQINLEVIAVPEPTSLAFCTGLLLACAGTRRRRKP